MAERVTISIVLDSNLLKLVEEKAKEERRSRSMIIEMGLEKVFEYKGSQDE